MLFTPYYLYEIDTNGFLHEVNKEMCIKWYSDNKIDIQFQKWEVWIQQLKICWANSKFWHVIMMLVQSNQTQKENIQTSLF